MECSRCKMITNGQAHLMLFGKYRNLPLCESCYLHQCYSKLHNLRCSVDRFFTRILFYMGL